MLTGLTILFVALKLLHYIDWSWFIVCIPAMIKIMLCCSGIFIIILTSLFNHKRDDEND